MLQRDASADLRDAQAEFRQRLARKLAASGYSGQEAEDKITGRLTKRFKLRLNVEEVIDPEELR